ncbi:MAG: XRE family transcriptional regulator [Clostridia bacterium]|nr:XRE family transcriptional regulator [Clostridia bacterium]
MQMKEQFSKNLKACRKAAGMSQNALAEQLGYTGKAVSKWESGTALPPTELLPRLASLLGTDLNTLFDYRETPSYFLGIDGGGTKTQFVLQDAAGTVLGELRLSACNPYSVGLEQAVAVLSEGIRTLCQGIPYGKVSVFAGIAGAGVGNARQELENALSAFRFSALKIDNDAANIIGAGLQGRNGVVGILGTGSVVFAVIDGTRHQIGGYGHLLGDALSGSELGKCCLAAAYRELDGSGEPTSMTPKVLELLGKDPLSAITDIYEKGKSYIATFATVLLDAATEGDPVAVALLEENIKQFDRQLTAALKFCPPGAPVVLAGGITRLYPAVLKKLNHKIEIMSREPVYGALLLAGGTIHE